MNKLCCEKCQKKQIGTRGGWFPQCFKPDCSCHTIPTTKGTNYVDAMSPSERVLEQQKQKNAIYTTTAAPTTESKGKVYLRERAHPDCSCDHEETLPPNNSQQGKPIRMWKCKRHGNRSHDLAAPTTEKCLKCGHIGEEVKEAYWAGIKVMQEEDDEDLELNSNDWKHYIEEIRKAERERIAAEVEKMKVRDAFMPNSDVPSVCWNAALNRVQEILKP